MGWGPIETRWSTDLQAYGTGVWMEGANWCRRINPTIAAAVPTGIVESNYSRAEESNASDLRLHPITRAHWALNLAYITSVICHGELENDTCHPSDLYPPTEKQRDCAAAAYETPYALVVGPILGQTIQITRDGTHTPYPTRRDCFVLQNDSKHVAQPEMIRILRAA